MKKTALTFISLLFCVVSALGDVVDDWHRDQAAIEALLQQKQYAAARKASIKLTNRMLDRLGGNVEAGKLLAQTVSLRASAEEGLGNADDTIWYRQVAKVLDPQIVQAEVAEPQTPAYFPTGKLEAPQSTRKRMPERPAIVNALGEAIVVIEVVIDVDGMVRQPHIVNSPAPSVSYAGLEAIRQWRFRPGKMDGKPVPVLFHMTFNFH